jgi:hypothetical protein
MKFQLDTGQLALVAEQGQTKYLYDTCILIPGPGFTTRKPAAGVLDLDHMQMVPVDRWR